MLKFSTQHLRNVFSDEEKYKVFRKLCYDLNHGNEIFEYGDDGVERAISKDEANKAVRKVLMEICELDETDLKSKKKRKRALKSHLNEVFEVMISKYLLPSRIPNGSMSSLNREMLLLEMMKSSGRRMILRLQLQKFQATIMTLQCKTSEKVNPSKFTLLLTE